MKNSVLFLYILLTNTIFSETQGANNWLTLYEKSNYLQTPRYEETINYCKRLAKASPWVRYTSFGRTPQGRDLPLVILSKERAFTPAEAAKTKKAIVLIQSGIHAGEIDGKDASLMLMRDIAITKNRAAFLDRAIVLFVPIFNVDGHERFGKYNRINQNGPEEMGWRVTAQNLNLNRDYMKADAPEMRAMLKLFADWLPDFYVDCHVTDGMDFQYDVTFSMELYPNLDSDIVRWLKQTYLPAMITDVETSNHGIAPYIAVREDRDLSKGFAAGAGTPRFSTGYGAAQNRPTLLIETHMLKSYKARVSSTYEMLVSTLAIVNREAETLRAIVERADKKVIAAPNGDSYLPLRFQTTEKSRPMEFRGIRSTFEFSEISGDLRTVYSHEPVNIATPYFEEVIAIDSVKIPKYYFIPQAWTKVIDVLKAHEVRMWTLGASVTSTIESYKFSDVKWQERPFEGRHPVKFKSEAFSEVRTFPAGTFVVPTAQRTGKVLMNLLEPNGPDSFVGWGFFDGIFEQKEYGENYVLENLARDMLAKDPALKKEFEAKIAADSAFAKSPNARLNFFYQRSPYWDTAIGVYPVARVMEGPIKEEKIRIKK
jgi:murein tripeptide amidase MpaA